MNELGVGLGTSGVSAGVVEMVRFGDCGGGVQYLHLVLRRLHRERSATRRSVGTEKIVIRAHFDESGRILLQ